MLAIIKEHIIPAAFQVLPPQMNTPAARRMLIATGWQETKFTHRRQINGPALGFWQFQLDGTQGVIEHHRSNTHLVKAIRDLQYPSHYATDALSLHAALEHNDTLAAILARLLLWTLPVPLPDTPESGHRQYLDAWRPGRKRPQDWVDSWRIAGQ